MITVRYLNDPNQECMIRPTPFVAISMSPQRNKECMVGVTYTITLTGTILSDEGMPYALHPNDWQQLLPAHASTGAIGTRTGPFKAFDKTGVSSRPRPPKQKVTKHSHAILSKQRILRSLFARDNQIIQISDIEDENAPVMWFFARFVSCSFEEGPYVNTSNYTVVVETDAIAQGNPSNNPIYEAGGFFDFCWDGEEDSPEEDIIENFSENWQIEPEENPENLSKLRTYRVTHTLNATGKPNYYVNGGLKTAAWENAKRWVVNHMSNTATESNVGYPNVNRLSGGGQAIAADNINLDINQYTRGWNHSANESIDKTGGSYSVTENWILSDDPVLESFSSSINGSSDNPFTQLDITGTITGLSAYLPEGYQNATDPNDKFVNATFFFNNITSNGSFNAASSTFQRASAIMNAYSNKNLNPTPVSFSVSYDEFQGVISYNVSYSDKPQTTIDGALSEQISISDTAPGDVFATIPVLGRQTGPVLQYIGGRTEYKRDISINLIMDRNHVAYQNNRNQLVLQKPSASAPQGAQLAKLIKDLSPANEPGIRKWFVAPPQESWNPKDGTYSINMSFVYELEV